MTDGRLAVLTRGFMARGADAWTAKQRAMAAINGQLGIQASVIGFSKVYLLSGLILLASLPLLFLLKPGHTRHAGPAVME